MGGARWVFRELSRAVYHIGPAFNKIFRPAGVWWSLRQLDAPLSLLPSLGPAMPAHFVSGFGRLPKHCARDLDSLRPDATSDERDERESNRLIDHVGNGSENGVQGVFHLQKQ